MSHNFQIGNITLGCADGENEAKEDWFADLFYKDNGKVEEVTNDKSKFIISGRKGTGKTILAKYIEHECKSKGILTAFINKENFSMQYLIEMGSKCVSDIELFHFLKYSILVQIAILIVNQRKDVLYSLKGHYSLNRILQCIIEYIKCYLSLYKLKKFYLSVYPAGPFKPMTLEQETLNEQEKSMQKSTTKFRHYNRKKYFEQKKTYIDLETELSDLVFGALKYCEVYLFFDDLDELEDKVFTETKTSKIFISLLEALQSINNQFNENHNKNSKCVILLRTDIIDSLHGDSSNLGKIMTDCQVRLNWLAKNPSQGNHPLLDMILTKIQKKCFPKCSKIEIFQSLFPNNIQRKPFIKYLLDYSFGRPRDIVNFLNIIINNNRINSKFHQAMFTDNTSLKEYSSCFLNEIKNEMSIHFSSDTIDFIFKVLKKFARQKFYFQEFNTFYEGHYMAYNKFSDSKTLIEILYQFGVLGNEEFISSNNPSKRVKINTSFSYREDGNPDPDFTKRFIVHYALRKALNF